jgi:hypothetical protein
MATVNDIVVRTKRLLNSNTRTELNNFGVATLALSTDSSLTLSHQTDGIRAGSYISVGDGTTEPESMYVRSRNGLAIEVIRGVDGSAPAVWGTDALIEVEPRFTEHQILEAVRDSIRAMPNNLYAVDNVAVSFSTTQQSVTTPFLKGFTQVLSATRTARTGEDRLIRFNIKVQQYGNDYEVIRQEGIEKAVTAQVTYAHPFVTATLAPDTILEGTVGMPVELQDIPALGAAATLVLGEESLRLDLHSQGDSRNDAAVAAGDRARYSMVLQAQYDRRVSEEARRLMSKWGVRTGAAVSSVFPTTVR